MKTYTVILVTALLSGPVLAQKGEDARVLDDILGPYKTAVLAGGTIETAFRTEEDYELGTVYDSLGSTEKVLFIVCKTNQKMVVPRDKIRITTTDKCESLPGASPDPIKIGSVTRWIFNAEQGVYLVHVGGSDASVVTPVPCREAPFGIIKAAGLSKEFEKISVSTGFQKLAVVGDRGRASAIIAGMGGNQIESLFTDSKESASIADCENASSFWTAPASVKGDQVVLGVTVTNPER